jgi:hypothetical protein
VKTQLSPFVQHNKKSEVTFSKDSIELYNKICQHGLKRNTNIKEEMIIDYGMNFAFVPDFADSVAHGGWLSNSMCEIGLHVLAQEMASQKKHIMSLNTSVSASF